MKSFEKMLLVVYALLEVSFAFFLGYYLIFRYTMPRYVLWVSEQGRRNLIRYFVFK